MLTKISCVLTMPSRCMSFNSSLLYGVLIRPSIASWQEEQPKAVWISRCLVPMPPPFKWQATTVSGLWLQIPGMRIRHIWPFAAFVNLLTVYLTNRVSLGSIHDSESLLLIARLTRTGKDCKSVSGYNQGLSLLPIRCRTSDGKTQGLIFS